MSEIVERHYLRNGSEALPDAREALEWATETRAAMVDLKFCDLLGTWQHVSLPIFGIRGVGVRRRARLRRLVDSRLAGDPELRHAPHAGSVERDPRPGDRGADALARLRDRRSDHARAVREGPARRRPAGGGAPPRERNRGHRLLRSRVRVLRLRRGPLRPRAEPLPLLGRLARGLLELGHARASATRLGRRRATSQRRRRTRSTTSARRWC